MNIKTTILSTIAIIAAASAATPAFAGDGGGMQRPGARFSFAPSIYKIEEPRMPQGYGQPAQSISNHSVRHGVTPKGSSILGIDPSMLAARPAPRGPRVAPIAQQQVSGMPSWTAIVPQLNPFATPVANKGQFGKPITFEAPVVAALPPQASKPLAAKPIAPATSTNLSGTIKPRRSTEAVSGRLAKRPAGLRAKPGSGIQSYGNQFYASGSTAPTGIGQTAHTSVSAVLYKSTNKH